MKIKQIRRFLPRYCSALAFNVSKHNIFLFGALAYLPNRRHSLINFLDDLALSLSHPLALLLHIQLQTCQLLKLKLMALLALPQALLNALHISLVDLLFDLPSYLFVQESVL
jgi:hypothetical protein